MYMNTLQNKLHELQAKLKDVQHENIYLQKLQIRQEKTLNKFEDTKNKIFDLISRHNREMQLLKEYIQSCKEQKHTTLRRVKATKEDLYKTHNYFQKLNIFSREKHLAEHEALEEKLVLAENTQSVQKRKVKDLEKNAGLNQSTFQQHLLSQKKDAHKVHKENKALQQKLLWLNQKLKEKELAGKKMNSGLAIQPSLERKADLLFGKRHDPNPVSTKIIQTDDDILSVECSSSPPSSPHGATQIKEQEDNLKREQKEDEKKRQEMSTAKEKELKKEQKQQVQEGKAQRCCNSKNDREREESLEQENECSQDEKERSKLEFINCRLQHQNQQFEDIKDKLWIKNIILQKMLGINPQSQNSLYSGSPSKNTHTSSKVCGLEKRKTRVPHHRTGLTFGCYSPSFGREPEQSPVCHQKGLIFEETCMNTTASKKVTSPTLMEQLFGVSANSPSAFRGNCLKLLSTADGSKAKCGFSRNRPLGEGAKNTITVNRPFSPEKRCVNSNINSVQHATSRGSDSFLGP